MTTELLTTPQTKHDSELRQQILKMVDYFFNGKGDENEEVVLDWDHHDLADALGTLRVEREDCCSKWGRNFFEVYQACRPEWEDEPHGIVFYIRAARRVTERQIQFLKDCFATGVYKYE